MNRPLKRLKTAKNGRRPPTTPDILSAFFRIFAPHSYSSDYLFALFWAPFYCRFLHDLLAFPDFAPFTATALFCVFLDYFLLFFGTTKIFVYLQCRFAFCLLGSFLACREPWDLN